MITASFLVHGRMGQISIRQHKMPRPGYITLLQFCSHEMLQTDINFNRTSVKNAFFLLGSCSVHFKNTVSSNVCKSFWPQFFVNFSAFSLQT